MIGTKGKLLRVWAPVPSRGSISGTARRELPTRGRTPTLPAAVAILLLLGACSQPPPPVTAAPRNPAVCEALRPAMPISYSSSRDTAETVKGVRQANARYGEACP